MTKLNPFRYFKTSPEIIRLAVMLYIRFPLPEKAPGGWGYFGDSKGRDQHHANRRLGAISYGTQTRKGRHGGDGQQDSAHRLGSPVSRRSLSRLTNRLRQKEQRQQHAAVTTCKGKCE